MAWLARHLKHNAIAYLALFVALGSTSVAAVTLQKNSVLSSTIKNGQVKNSDLAKNAVDATKVKDASLRAGDFAPNQLPAGPRGLQGEKGAKGDQGIPGPQEPVTSEHVQDNSLTGADIFDNALTGADIDESSLVGFAAAAHNHDATYVNTNETDSVNAAMIANPTRMVSIPITSLQDCDSATYAPLDYTSGTDAIADFSSATDGGPLRLLFDATVGSEDQDAEICANLMVPSDYASGGKLVIRGSQTVHTGSAVESIRCASATDNTGPGSPVNVTPPSGTASFTCVPAFSDPPVPNEALTVSLAVGATGGTMNDPVNVLALGFEYVATQ
jgi:hypothetical protein